MIKIGKKMGKFKWPLMAILWSVQAFASLQAVVDRTEVPLDESFSFKVSASGTGLNPKFDAPDFEIMNQFQNSQFSSVYENGKFENKSENSVTFILRPKKVGALRIRNITNGAEHAPDLTVQVIQENLYKKQASGEAPKLQGDAKNFFVKTELSKTRVYKGEQTIVSYYLYRRTRAQVRDVMQYPSFQGFIREDLEMPILNGRPDFEAVNLGGVPFERALLARYAIYPIKDGKLKIDGFSVRVDYIPKNPGSDDMMEDPFFQFFTQVTPRTGTSKSDPVTIDVLPVPDEGRSNLFTGGVGDFEVSASLDNANAKTNAPLTLRVSVRGKGNTSLVEFPNVNWPKELKFYETQGKSKNLGQGSSEKTFEVVLVPQVKGTLEIPSIEFEFFNPESRAFARKKTAPISIQVQEGDAGSGPLAAPRSEDVSGPNAAATPAANTYGELRNREKRIDSSTNFLGQPWWRWVAWFGIIVFLSFIGLVVFDHLKKRSIAQLDAMKRKQNAENFWKAMERDVKANQSATQDPALYAKVMEKIEDEVYRTLDENFGILSRALPSRELTQQLIETHGVSETQAKQVARIRELTEMLRFSSAGSFSPQSDTANQVQEIIQEAKKLCLEVSTKKLG